MKVSFPNNYSFEVVPLELGMKNEDAKMATNMGPLKSQRWF